MIQYSEIGKEQIRELLNANWMTHDAAWFALTASRFGIDETNILNRQAVRSMARAEAKRLRKLLGIRKINDFAELQNFLISAFDIIRGKFMAFSLEFREPNEMLWKVPGCFAHDGVKRLGFIDKYECGIVERLFGWFEELDIRYSLTPLPDGCNMQRLGKCEMKVCFEFP